jgi:hypothetical protein
MQQVDQRHSVLRHCGLTIWHKHEQVKQEQLLVKSSELLLLRRLMLVLGQLE